MVAVIVECYIHYQLEKIGHLEVWSYPVYTESLKFEHISTVILTKLNYYVSELDQLCLENSSAEILFVTQTEFCFRCGSDLEIKIELIIYPSFTAVFYRGTVVVHYLVLIYVFLLLNTSIPILNLIEHLFGMIFLLSQS